MLDFKDSYCVCSCAQSMRLYDETQESFGSYLMIEQSNRADKDGVVSVVQHPFVYGYLFVPAVNVIAMRRAVQSFFNFKPLYTKAGSLYLVAQAELYAVQERLNVEYSGALHTPDVLYELGERVAIIGHPLVPDQSVGEVIKFKGGGRLRLFVGLGVITFLDVPASFVEKL